MPWHVSVTDVNLWNVKDPPKDEAVPTNAAFCKQIIISGIPLVFRWFSSSSLTVPKGPTTIGITVALTSHNLWTCNLKSGIWWFFLAPSLRFFDLQEQLCRWFCILSSLYQWLQYLVFGDLFLYLFGLQSPKAFYICHFPPLVLVDARTICLHIQSQISCIGASVLYFQVCRVSSCIGFQLGQNTNWQYGWHFQLSLCRACVAKHVLVINAIFYCLLTWLFVLSACSWAAHIRLSVSRFSSPAFSHCHLLWSCIPSVSLRNWPCNAFSFHAACLSFSRSSLFFPTIFVLSCNSSVAGFRSLSLFFAA